MSAYRQAIRQALDDGFLVAQSGTTWLTCEVAWRRHCVARKQPAVVVSCRDKFADVYMLLNKIPHRDLDSASLKRILNEIEVRGVPESHVNVQRGTKGAPELFTGLSITDVSIEQAMELAPYLCVEGEALVCPTSAPAKSSQAAS